MNPIKYSLLFILFTLTVNAQNKTSSAPANLSKNGMSVCSVIIGEHADNVEQLAATEFTHYIKELSGAVVTIQKPGQLSRFNTQVVIGLPQSNSLLKKILLQEKLQIPEDLGPGYVLKTIRSGNTNYLLITGTSPKGVLNGVYAFIEEILSRQSGKKFTDIDYKLDTKVTNMTLPAVDIIKKPHLEYMGFGLEGMGINNEVLLDRDKREYEFGRWAGLVDWARRHKMNFISNWPYGGVSSMNNFPDMTILEGYKPISSFSKMEIEESIKHRKRFLKYASDNGVEPYLMIYVPGWINQATAQSYPEFIGKNRKGFVENSGGRPFNWGNPEVYKFMADLVSGIVKTYPEIKGLHFRVWGSESAPDSVNYNNRNDLIKHFIKEMVTAANTLRPDITVLISEFSNFNDPNFAFFRSLPGKIVLQNKWDRDWAVSNDPKVPKSWLNVKDNITRVISHSIPNEEAIPFWFPSAKLYQEGILRYNTPEKAVINGLPINFREWDTDNCDNTLNLSAISKLSWDPFNFSHEQFYKDAYYFLFGPQVEREITEACRIQTEVCSDFLKDYGGIIDGMDAGNWLSLHALIGKGDDNEWYKGIRHITEKANKPEALSSISARLNKVLPMQEQAVSLLKGADNKVIKNREMFENLLHVNQIWYYIIRSRMDAVELVSAQNLELKKQKLEAFRGTAEQMKFYTRQLTNFTHKAVGDYPVEIRRDFINRINSEVNYLNSIVK